MGRYYSTVPVGAIALTVAGLSMMYADGTYYKTTYVQGATQYQVVAPPAGAALPPGTSLPADRSAITIAGVTYYVYGNTFYKRMVTNGQESFVVVIKPAGVVAVKALPADAEPMQAGSIMYFRSKGRYYLTYLDPNGEELYIVVDTPAGAVPAVATAPPAGPDSRRRRSGSTCRQADGRLPDRAAGHTPDGARLDRDQLRLGASGPTLPGQPRRRPVASGRVVATRGTRAYGRVVAATAGTGMGGKPSLALELTDIEVGGRVVPLATDPQKFSAEAKKPGKKILGGAALGAGIGGIIDGGEGAGKGAAVGAVVGVAAAASSPGNQVAVAPGTAIEFRLAKPLSVDIVV